MSHRTGSLTKSLNIVKNKTLASQASYSNYRVAILSRGQMFGDQDAYHERPYRETVICSSSDGELYRISRKNFRDLKNYGD